MLINANLDEAIMYLIHRDKTLINKSSLLEDLSVINDLTSSDKSKLVSFERLITYLSHLSILNEELITFLGNRFMALKLKEMQD